MVRIISNWSNMGGSTTAFINLTNAFNRNGIDCIFYGAHQYHLNKCRAEQLTTSKLIIDKSDRLIFHFRIPPRRPPCHKVILSCHEQDIFKISKIDLSMFDAIHFVSQHQIEYHGNLNHPSFVIPNVLDDLKPNQKPMDKVVGIIGSVDPNKQVHVSIERALADGFTDIRIFGAITDPNYWKNVVAPLVDGSKVKYLGVSNDKQGMYDQLTDVYFSSINECKPYVVAECQLTGTIIHTLPNKNYMNQKFIYNEEEVINMWKKELDL